MPVDHGFDLLGMDLQPADIDDPAATTGEIVAVSPELHEVAGVDDPVGIEEIGAPEVAARGARRADAEGAVDPLHGDAAVGFPEQAGREPFAAVVPLETAPRLGRGIA